MLFIPLIAFTPLYSAIILFDVPLLDDNNGISIVGSVAAMTENNEVTLRTFYKEKNHIRSQPENNNMEPLIFKNVTILGKAIGLYRKF